MTEASEPGAAPLNPATQERIQATRLGWSLDWLAVLLAVVLAIAVRLGLKIPW